MSDNSDRLDALEKRISRLEAEKEQLKKQVDNNGGVGPSVSRRATLASVAGLAGLSAVGSASGAKEEGTETPTATPAEEETVTPDQDYDLGSDQAPLDVRAGRVTAGEVNNVVNVTTYPGADLGEQFNAAIDDSDVANVTFDVPPGEYEVTTTIQLDGDQSNNPWNSYRNNVTVDLSGAHLVADTTDNKGTARPVIEVNDIGMIRIEGGLIQTASDNSASVGILLYDGGTEGGGDGDVASAFAGGPEGKYLLGTRVKGAFTTAPVYIHGREHIVVRWCRFRDDGSNGFVGVISRKAVPDISSDGSGPVGNILPEYVARSEDGETPTPISEEEKEELRNKSSPKSVHISESKFFSTTEKTGGAGTGLSQGGVFYLEGGRHSTFRDSEICSSGEPFFVCDARNYAARNLTFEALRMRSWSPKNQTNSGTGFLLRDGGEGTRTTGITFRDIFFWNASSGSATDPFIDVQDNIDCAKFNIIEPKTIGNADVGFRFSGDWENSVANLTNRKVDIDGNLEGVDLKGKLGRYTHLNAVGDDDYFTFTTTSQETFESYGDLRAEDSVVVKEGVRIRGFDDLRNVEGSNGEIRNHRGAGSAPRGPAQWDTVLAGGSGNWQSLVDGTVFGPN